MMPRSSEASSAQRTTTLTTTLTTKEETMVFAGIKVPDTTLVRDAMELARGLLEPFLFNHVMRSWLFGVVLSEGSEHAPDAELLAVAAVLHDLGLTDRYTERTASKWME